MTLVAVLGRVASQPQLGANLDVHRVCYRADARLRCVHRAGICATSCVRHSDLHRASPCEDRPGHARQHRAEAREAEIAQASIYALAPGDELIVVTESDFAVVLSQVVPGERFDPSEIAKCANVPVGGARAVSRSCTPRGNWRTGGPPPFKSLSESPPRAPRWNLAKHAAVRAAGHQNSATPPRVSGWRQNLELPHLGRRQRAGTTIPSCHQAIQRTCTSSRHRSRHAAIP